MKTFIVTFNIVFKGKGLFGSALTELGVGSFTIENYNDLSEEDRAEIVKETLMKSYSEAKKEYLNKYVKEITLASVTSI